MNYTKTFMMMAGMTALFAAIGALIGGQSGMLMAFGFAVITNLGSYWFSDKIVLRMYNAQPVTSGHWYEMTARLAANAQLPMPKFYIIENPQPNAFATGRNPANAAVAVNTGLLDIMTDDEVEGVIAHELAHIKNRDTLIMTLTATMAGAISMLANFAMFFGGSSSDNNRPANPLIGLIVMILAPLAAMVVQMAISRTREYAADRLGAQISGNPMGLANALRKLEQGSRAVDNMTAENNPATAHMFIINPLHGRPTDSLFSTHPATANRIRQLEELAGTTPAPSQTPRPKTRKLNLWKR